MAEAERKPVFFCRGRRGDDPDLAYRRLRWTAEALGGPELEVARACQTRGACELAQAARELGSAEFILAACPRAWATRGLATALHAEGMSDAAALLVDVFEAGPEAGAPCRVREGAEEALRQALVAAAARVAPTRQVQVVEQRTLVLGDGLAALLAAEAIADTGRPVVILTAGGRLAPARPWLGAEAEETAAGLARALEQRAGVEVVRRARLTRLLGTAGDFIAVYRDENARASQLRVGAVVAAGLPPLVSNPPAGWPTSPGVVTLRELWAWLSSPEHFRKALAGAQRPRVGLALGLGLGESNPLWLRSACLAARELIAAWDAEVTLFVNTLKVSAPGLEELSQEARSLGALLVRLPKDGAGLEPVEGGLRLRYLEEIIGRVVEQELDLVAVDEVTSHDAAWQELVQALGLAGTPGLGLQPSLVAALPVQTERAGVMAVGPARGLGDWTGWPDEAKEAAWQVERLLGAAGEGPVVETGRVVVDRRRCALCLTCVRVCPRGAMGRRERRPFSNPLACTACGTCAAECPMDAIQVAGCDDQRYAREIGAAAAPRGGLLDPAPQLELLVLACANSAGEALREASLRGQMPPAGTRLVSVPCAGKIDPGLVLDALRRGFDGVLMLSCFPGACYSQAGNLWAGLRLEPLRRLLEEAGLEPGRVMSAAVAPTGHAQVGAELARAWRDLRELGANPIRNEAQAREFLGRFTVSMDHTYVIL